MTSDNKTVCIPSFVLTDFWCSTSYTVIFVLWRLLMEPVNAPARWWPWACLNCVSGLRRLEKTLNFLRCIHVIDPVLKNGSNMNEGNWLQLLFCLIVLIGLVASVIGISFFSFFSVFGPKFSRIASWRKRWLCNWIPKVIWPRMDWFWVFFCWKMAPSVDLLSVWTKICMNCWFVNLFWRHHFFRCLVWGKCWSVH